MTLTESISHVYDGLRNGYDDSYWWRGRFLEFVIAPFHTNVYPRRDGAIRVMERDWDTLIVLDACREDLFEERTPTERYSEYERVRSRGSTTREWVRQNFTGGEFGDTVYVTANPYVSMEAGDAFHRLYEPWIDRFDEELNTVPPGAVVEVAKDAHETYPDKRVVVHFMQPHHPFMTAPALQFDGWHIAEHEEWRNVADTERDAVSEDDGPSTPWEALAKGLIDREKLWSAYGENLDLALEAVDDLIQPLDGRVVVTSDHGNMLGERTFPIPLRVYGHPVGIRNKELVEVPWATIDAGPRREISSGDTESGTDKQKAVVEDRLEALGYR